MFTLRDILSAASEVRKMSRVSVTTPVVKLIAKLSDGSPRTNTISAFVPASASSALIVITSVPSGDPSTTSAINGRRGVGALSLTSMSSMETTTDIWKGISPPSVTVMRSMMVGDPPVSGSRSNSTKFRRMPLLSMANLESLTS